MALYDKSKRAGQDRNGVQIRVGCICMNENRDSGVVTEIRGDAVILRQLSGDKMYRGGHLNDLAYQLQVTIEPDEIAVVDDDLRHWPTDPRQQALKLLSIHSLLHDRFDRFPVEAVLESRIADALTELHGLLKDAMAEKVAHETVTADERAGVA